ncbi:hypothetical protein T12_1330 [Trichinella patagoniensis]|uniref:Uncharacterized protein n=1 Tax=Trichinella patagoniensis TaxID=990121 RepID=A0A0V0ZVR2_9BILA|nr:hypothetical protein T12_1330 [Trichinella patagoniensis]
MNTCKKRIQINNFANLDRDGRFRDKFSRVVDFAILLDLRAVVLLRDVIGMFFFGPTVHLLVVDHAILLDRQIFVVLI